MKKFLLALLMLPLVAFAGSATLSWTPPTQNEDGSALTNLAGYKVYYGNSPTAMTTVGNVTAPASTTVVPNLGVGTWYFAMTAYNATGLESIKTATVSKVISAPPSPPLPPTGLSVTVTTAYTVIKRVNRFVMLPVGSVPADTPCDLTQSVNGYFVVPREAVTWSGSVKPDVVVATCG